MLPSLTPCNFPFLSQKSSKLNQSINNSILIHRYTKILKEKQKYSSIVKNLRIKIQKVEDIKEAYGVDIPRNVQLTPSNLKKLENYAKVKYRNQILSNTVNKIETWWKKRIINKKIEKFNSVLENSAKTIQRYWKKFIAKKKILDDMRKKHSAAVKIQKYIRGFMIRKKIVLKIKEQRMKKVFEYFSKEKTRIMQESAKKILSFWRIYHKKYLIKQENLKKLKKTLKGKRKNSEEFTNNSISAFPEPEPSKLPEGTERPTKLLTIKTLNKKHFVTPASPLHHPPRQRTNTEPNTALEVIKELKKEG